MYAILVKARESMIELCQEIVRFRREGNESMADWLDSELTGYRRAVSDICGPVVSGLLIMETDPILEDNHPRDAEE